MRVSQLASLALSGLLSSAYAFPLAQAPDQIQPAEKPAKFKTSLNRAKAFYNSTLGSLQAVTGKDLPNLTNLSLLRTILAPGSIREPHWYANGNELHYCLSGKVYVTILDSGSEFSHFTVSAGEMFLVASGSLQTVENVGDEEAELISAPRNPNPIDFSLSAAFGEFTNAVLGNTYNESAEEWSSIRRTTQPKFMVERQGPAKVPSTAGFPDRHKYDAVAQNPPTDFSYGTARLIRQQFFPILKDLSMYDLRIEDDGMREPHWHPDTTEMGYVANGHARMSLLDPHGQVTTYYLEAGDCYFVPINWPHQIENTGDDEFHFLIFFDQPTPADVGFKASASALGPEIMAAMLGIKDTKDLPELPFTPEDPLIVQRVNPVDPIEPGEKTTEKMELHNGL